MGLVSPPPGVAETCCTIGGNQGLCLHCPGGLRGAVNTVAGPRDGLPRPTCSAWKEQSPKFKEIKEIQCRSYSSQLRHG